MSDIRREEMILTLYAIDPYTGVILPYEKDMDRGLVLDAPEELKSARLITDCESEDDCLARLKDLMPEQYKRLFPNRP